MDFINTQIAVSDLPAAEEVTLQPVQHDYIRVLRIEWLITAVILAIIAGGLVFAIDRLRESYNWSLVAGAWLLLLIPWLIVQEKAFPFMAYAVRDKDVLYRKGWITRSVKICPLNRIQNCTVTSGPLERRFGLSSLIIYTAGTGGADLKIPGLLHNDADRLRHFILEKIHAEEHGNG
ncbi:MAG TPA: PH domain-containing protein [Flavisolibacter sp.]